MIGAGNSAKLSVTRIDCQPTRNIITVLTMKNKSAASKAANSEKRAALAPRYLALLLGGVCVMAGLDAALLRLNLPAPVTGAHLAALHGPLMLAGFLGTVISLERAVAARRRWAWVAPYAHAVGMLALLAGAPSAVGKGLLLVGALGLDAVYLYILRTRAGAVATQIEALGALSLTLGTWLWLMDKPLETVATLWLEFLIFTIIGERLELARVAFIGKVEGRVLGLCLAVLSFSALSLVWVPAQILAAAALLALALIMGYHDVARRTVRGSGQVRFAGAAMLSGYFWLAVSATVWCLYGFNGAAYDVVIHTVTIGYALSMVMAHASIILPGVLHRQLPYHPLMYLPLGALHGGLIVRVLTAHLGGLSWQVGGAVSIAAILLFLLIAVTRAVTAK